jgi:hypothetical protein
MKTGNTLQERIKFNYGLSVGQSLVKFTLGERSVLALVEIGNRGQVFYFKMPTEGDMYASWQKVEGDKTITGVGAIRVWPAKDADFMAKFAGEPSAIIPIQ